MSTHRHDHPHDHSHPHAQDHSHADSHGHEHAAGLVADASVRIARASDVPAVGLVQSVVWREAYAAVLAPEVLDQFEPRAFTNAWRHSISAPPSPDHLLLVACAGEQVVGFAAVGPSDDPDAGDSVAELLVIGVHPDARRQGHGSRLLNAVVDTARGRGRDTLNAWALATDEHTRAFLHAAGLEPDGAHRTRIVSEDGATAAEVRLTASVAAE